MILEQKKVKRRKKKGLGNDGVEVWKGERMESRHETEQNIGLEEEELACQVRRFFHSKCSPALIYAL